MASTNFTDCSGFFCVFSSDVHAINFTASSIKKYVLLKQLVLISFGYRLFVIQIKIKGTKKYTLYSKNKTVKKHV